MEKVGPHLQVTGNGVTVDAGAREVDGEGAPVSLQRRRGVDGVRGDETMKMVAAALSFSSRCGVGVRPEGYRASARCGGG